MLTDDIVVQAVDLRKVYRLYSKPSHRFLDMFGLLRRADGAYSEHAAVDGVTLSIRRGEKVAVIGRNGAGKSTLLKLITGVVEPTSGVLAVRGQAHALLQIGTGFHPDFTGRENVLAYLAQLGVTGREAARRCAEIVEFSELEEYIGQPVKTYSTGMAVRLMFSAATAITPELLVLDEVLGVGDAYFAQKSYERIRDLCHRDGTTLLLVTHDVYSAAKICERVLWVDRGRILMDSDASVVIRAYEDSIRQQEEQRLRLKKQERLRVMAAERAPASGALLVEIKSVTGRPPRAPVHFGRIAVTGPDGELACLPLGDEAFDEAQPAHLQREGSSWGEPEVWQGRAARALLPFGGSFHKVAGVLPPPPDRAAAALEVDYWMEEEAELVVDLFRGAESSTLGHLAGPPGEWHRATLPLAAQPVSVQAASVQVNTSGVHGSGALVVRAVRTLGDDGRETFSLEHGKAATIEIDFEIVDPALRERPHVVVALHRDGVQDVCRWIARDLPVDAAAARRGTFRLRIPRLVLTDGSYSVTVLIAKEGYYDRDQTKFYTINADVYYCASRMFDFVVRGGGLVGSGTVSVAEGDWQVAT